VQDVAPQATNVIIRCRDWQARVAMTIHLAIAYAAINRRTGDSLAEILGDDASTVGDTQSDARRLPA